MDELLSNVTQIVVTAGSLVLMVVANTVMRFLNAKKYALQSKVQGEKINSITTMVDDNIRQEVNSKLTRVKNNWNNNLYNKESGGTGSLSEAISNAKKDIASIIKATTSDSVITYLTKEHIGDFDAWVNSRVNHYVSLKLDDLSPTDYLMK